MKAMRDVWGDTLVAVRQIESKRAGLGRRLGKLNEGG